PPFCWVDMWCRIFPALPLACLTAIFLLSVRCSTVAHELFASAVGTMNRGGDHGIFRLSNDFCPYFTTPFPFPPLPTCVYERFMGVIPCSSLLCLLILPHPTLLGKKSNMSHPEFL